MTMKPRKEKGSSKSPEQILREEMGNGQIADQAIRELSALGQEWAKTRAFERRMPEPATSDERVK
jgi:hypothetical protein